MLGTEYEAGHGSADEKSRAILKAAAAVFLAHGFSAATTDMIQKAARVSKATLYACFPGKEAMFAAVIEQECILLAESVRAIEAVPGNVVRTLTQIGESYLQIILSPTGLALYRVVVAEAPRFPRLARQFYLAGPKTTVAIVARQLELAAQGGEINLQSIGIEAAAAQFINLLRGEALMECLMHPEAQPSAEQFNRWVHMAVSVFMAAFGTTGHR